MAPIRLLQLHLLAYGTSQSRVRVGVGSELGFGLGFTLRFGFRIEKDKSRDFECRAQNNSVRAYRFRIRVRSGLGDRMNLKRLSKVRIELKVRILLGVTVMTPHPRIAHLKYNYNYKGYFIDKLRLSLQSVGQVHIKTSRISARARSTNAEGYAKPSQVFHDMRYIFVAKYINEATHAWRRSDVVTRAQREY